MNYSLLKTGRQGFGMLEILIVLSIGSIALLAMSQGLVHFQRAERGLASNMDLSQLGHAIRLMTSTSENCGRTTLIGENLSSLFNTPSEPVAVEVSFRDLANNIVGTRIKAGEAFGGRNIERLEFSSVVPISATTFMGNLQLSTSVMGNAMTVRDPNQSYLLQLELDADRKIISCRSENSSATANRGAVKLYPDCANVNVYGNPASGPQVINCGASSYTPSSANVLISVQARMTIDGSNQYGEIQMAVEDMVLGSFVNEEGNPIPNENRWDHIFNQFAGIRDDQRLDITTTTQKTFTLTPGRNYRIYVRHRAHDCSSEAIANDTCGDTKVHGKVQVALMEFQTFP